MGGAPRHLRMQGTLCPHLPSGSIYTSSTQHTHTHPGR